MWFEVVRISRCRLKISSVWLAAVCAMSASCLVLLLTLAGFGMTAWLNDTSPTWEKRLDAGLVLWIVILNASNLFLLPAAIISGLNPMRVLDGRELAWTATLPVLVMCLGLMGSAVGTSLAAMSTTLTAAIAHWLMLLHATNAISGVTVCISMWVGNRFRSASWNWVAARSHRTTLIVVALLCCISGVASTALTGPPDRWVPTVVATTIVEIVVALGAAWLVWQVGKRNALP